MIKLDKTLGKSLLNSLTHHLKNLDKEMPLFTKSHF